MYALHAGAKVCQLSQTASSVQCVARSFHKISSRGKPHNHTRQRRSIGHEARMLGKTLCNTSAVQLEFCQIAFQPPALKQTDALWELFLPKIGKFVKTAVLTLEIDILTMTMVKLCS